MQIRNRRIQIRRGVIQILQGSETLQERLLWGKMQDLQRRGKKVRLLLQIQPQQTMPLKRETLGAKPVVRRLTVTVGQKLAEMLTTNWAFHLVAPIERAYQPTEQITHPDEPLAGKYLGEKSDQFLHINSQIWIYKS